MAQYSVGDSRVGSPNGAFVPLPTPTQLNRPLDAGSGVASMMIPSIPVTYQTPSNIGSGIPVQMPPPPTNVPSPYGNQNFSSAINVYPQAGVQSSNSKTLPESVNLGSRNNVPGSESAASSSRNGVNAGSSSLYNNGLSTFPGAPSTSQTPATTPSYPTYTSAPAYRSDTGNSTQLPYAESLAQPDAPLTSADYQDSINTLAPGVQGLTGEACGESCYGPQMQSLNPWIVGGNGLIFNRIGSDCNTLSRNYNDPTYPLLCTSLVDMPTTGGFEVFGGRYFGCGRYAIMGSYWGLFSQDQHASVAASPGVGLTSALPFTIDSPYGGATQGIQMSSQFVSDWFNDAPLHYVNRGQDFQNFELNFVSFALGGGARQPYAEDCQTGGCGSGTTGACAPWYGAECSRLRLNMFGGFRWFQFRDNLVYGASNNDDVFDYSADDFFYQNSVSNNLFGGQLGALATYCTGHRFNLWFGSSFGVYNNRMALESYAGTASEAATVLSSNIYNGNQFSFTNNANGVALLGEGSAGVGVRLTRGWTANIGYRLIGATGLATSTGQISHDFSNLNESWKLRNDRSVVLQGLTLGAMYNF